MLIEGRWRLRPEFAAVTTLVDVISVEGGIVNYCLAGESVAIGDEPVASFLERFERVVVVDDSDEIGRFLKIAHRRMDALESGTISDPRSYERALAKELISQAREDHVAAIRVASSALFKTLGATLSAVQQALDKAEQEFKS